MSDAWFILVSLAVFTALTVVYLNFVSPSASRRARRASLLIVRQIYRLHDIAALNSINITLFASGLAIHSAITVLQLASPSSFMLPHPSRFEFSLHHIAMLLVRAGLDWSALSLIYRSCPLSCCRRRVTEFDAVRTQSTTRSSSACSLRSGWRSCS